jgi:hypothetical protein
MPKRKSAYSAVLKEAQQPQTQQDSETVAPSNSDTVTPYYRETEERLYSNTVTQQKGETVEQFEKTTFYLTVEQVEKLDDLAHDHKKQTGQRINRNDIVRYLIDQATADSLDGIKRHVKRTTTHSQEQPNKSNAVEERFRTDTQVHHFKKWIRSHDHPQDIDFFRRFLADSQLPEHASRGLYEAKMRSAGYSEEDMHLFQDAWKTIIAEDLE